MLGQRRRRCANIKLASGVLTGVNPSGHLVTKRLTFPPLPPGGVTVGL